MEPANFRPITLESVPLKIFPSVLRNSIFAFQRSNNFIEHEIQKGFIPRLSEILEHNSLMVLIINRARSRQRFLVVTLLDLKNASGEVHHNLICKVLRYHHVPNHILQLIIALLTVFRACIIARDLIPLSFQSDEEYCKVTCLSPLIFNMCFNTVIQYIEAEKCHTFGFSYSNDSGLSFRPIHWFQFADDVVVITGNEKENQLLLNCFTIWCQLAGMTIRVDKFVTFGMRKQSTKSIQFQPKLIKADDSFLYLSAHFDFSASNAMHKSELLEILGSFMSDIDKLSIHPKNKLLLYQRHDLSKLLGI